MLYGQVFDVVNGVQQNLNQGRAVYPELDYERRLGIVW
jgi:hypothetical protein